MDGGFHKSLQLFVAYGYCVFEHDICVDLPNVLDGKPDYANAFFRVLRYGLCIPTRGPGWEA